MRPFGFRLGIGTATFAAVLFAQTASGGPVEDLLAGRFRWVASKPLIGASADDRGSAIKDPSVVYAKNRWHIYATLRFPTTAAMEYFNFADWQHTDIAERKVVSLVNSYHCAPQIFYFRPQKKWYLIYQWDDKNPGTGFFGPCYSTLDDVDRPATLTKPVMLFAKKPANAPNWIDFWVICDGEFAYLFFTGDDGRFWRSRTAIADFPGDWSEPRLVLKEPTNEFFEATHTYRLKGLDKFLTIAEALGPQDRRYYKAYLADKLNGEWRPLAASWHKPFASMENVTFGDGVQPWADAISHGELIRDGIDETLTVDPAHIRLLFQGCTAKERAGKKYPEFPWRLGLLEPDQN